MNSDEIKAIIFKVLIGIFTPLAAKYGIDGDTVTSVSMWAASGIVLAYSIYDHWNQKKVPETSIAVKAGTVVPPASVISPSSLTTGAKP
jgi:hypothetical protein